MVHGTRVVPPHWMLLCGSFLLGCPVFPVYGCTGKLQHSRQGRQQPSDFPALFPCEAVPEHILTLLTCPCFPDSPSLAFPSLCMVLPAAVSSAWRRGQQETFGQQAKAALVLVLEMKGSFFPATASFSPQPVPDSPTGVTAAGPFIFGHLATVLPSPAVTLCPRGAAGSSPWSRAEEGAPHPRKPCLGVQGGGSSVPGIK